MNDREKLTNSFVNSLNYGFVWSYFCIDKTKNKKNEHKLRKDLNELREDPTLGGTEALLEFLNSFYNTRFKKEHLGSLSESLKSIIKRNQDRLLRENLFENGSENPHFCQGIIQKIIQDVIQELKDCKPKAKRPYSLVTKFMHFYNPELFPIFDSQANKSWKVVEECLNLTGYSSEKGKKTDGIGYGDICKLYLKLREIIEPQREKVEGLIENIETTFNIEFSILDAFDKFFWLASGQEEFLFDYNYIGPPDPGHR
ncbi:MAG: hypothetical protein HY036_01650 [Nitrospirae bacterium]|nr:hypothetical protein [Nitrospirota bacterium]